MDEPGVHMKTPLTSKSLKHHLAYSWWKYLLIALLAFGLVDLLYSVTTYRPPRDKTLGFFVYGHMDEQGLNEWMENIRETEMPDLEEMRAQLLIEDDTYGPMQLMTYLAAGEGDVYLLPREEFLSYAANGSLVALENDAELMALFDAAGVSLQSGWRRETETGETHLYGIPQARLPGLSRYAWAQDGFVCVIITNGNNENAAKFLRILCRENITVPEPAEQPDPQDAQNGQP